MRGPFYSPDVTRFSKDVMSGIRRIDAETRGVSLLGGWAVHALVDEAHRQESQDIDVVIHNAAAWESLVPFLMGVKYEWRTFGKNEKDNAFIHELHKGMLVDFFFGRSIPDEIPQRLFNTRWMATIKDFPYEGFVPSLGTVLFDKLETLPKRQDPTKALKDALDARSLIFHNIAGRDPKSLMSASIQGVGRGALPAIERMLAAFPQYEAELGDLREFLRRHTR